jgi:20S proteasome alpha/beta subunit
MTVLVGVLCQDGVVVGSDSSATFAASAHLSTIEQPVRKTFVLAPDMILASTGSGGLGQRLEHLLRSLRQQTPNWLERHHQEIILQISAGMIQNMRSTFLPPGQIGALVAFACQDTFHLCEFSTADFQPEMKTEDTWFVSMGSGQMITDPFFGLLRRTLFRDSRPTLRQGILAACWALDNAIQLNTGGINGPMQLAILSRPDGAGPFHARLLDPDEVREYAAAIQGIEDYLADYRQRLTPREAKPPPVPPLPSGEKDDQA